jgi:hypothetical protein
MFSIHTPAEQLFDMMILLSVFEMVGSSRYRSDTVVMVMGQHY